MRKIFLAAALASCSLGLAACSLTPAPAPTASGSEAAPAGRVEAIAASAMYAAEAAYNVPAHAYVEADAKGLLTPEIKAKVKPLLIEAYDWLLKARTAYKVGDSVGFFQARSRLEEKTAAANELLPT